MVIDTSLCKCYASSRFIVDFDDTGIVSLLAPFPVRVFCHTDSLQKTTDFLFRDVYC